MSIFLIADSTTPALAQAASPSRVPAKPATPVTGPLAGPDTVDAPPAAKADGVPPNSKTPQGELIRASALIKTEGAIGQVVGAEQIYERTLAESGNAAAAAQLVWGTSKELVAAVDSELATFVGPNANPDDLEEARHDLLADHADFDPNANRVAGEALDTIFIRRLANRPDALAAATADFDQASKRLDRTFAAVDLTWQRIPGYLKQLQQAAAVKQAVWSEACRKADLGTDTKLQAERKRGLDDAEADVKRVNSRFFVETHSNLKYARAVAATREFERFVTVDIAGDHRSVEIRGELYDAWHTALSNAEDIGDPQYLKECRKQYLSASLWQPKLDE